MKNFMLTCRNEQRRHKVRERNLNGLDYLEVSKDQRRLTVYFLSKAPENLTKENVRITGGRRIRNVQVVELDFCRNQDPERDDCMIVTVDRPGDFSTYTLCLVDPDQDGRPTDQPFPDFDPRYACLDFSFKAGCPSDLDCKQQKICPPKEYDEPEVNYLAKDYASFRQLILDRLALIMPDWQERHVPDLGIALVELLAYTGDHLSYYQDAVATEAYLDTARQRISVRRHARLVDYQMHEGCNARAWVCVEIENSNHVELDPADIYFITGYEDTRSSSEHVLSDDDLRNIPSGQYEVFEPLVETLEKPIQLYRAHSKIQLYTWGDRECCLPCGATSATLKDGFSKVISASDVERTIAQQEQAPAAKETTKTVVYERELHLQPGDFLLFEEVIGPKTGNPHDADPTHRHAVRLIRVEPIVDELYQQPVLEIEWAEADALPFPLCISTIGPAPKCEYMVDISVVRGNVILVDHGRRIKDEELGIVLKERTISLCESEGRPSDVEIMPSRFRPMLQETPLTFSQPLPVNSPASCLLTQDPHQALPQLMLYAIPPVPGNVAPLFCPTDLEDPTDLLEKLLKTEDFASQFLRRLLSKETREFLKEWEETNIRPEKISEALVEDLRNLLRDWTAKPDLLGSQGDDRHFVVEVDNEGRAHLRFGDGELGQMPETGTKLVATYRIGNGSVGNVGIETISHIVLRNTILSGVNLRPRNPLPAQGGTASEPLAEVKLYAPYAFRVTLQRAITADDYADLVMREFKAKVQRAAATLRWMGSWYEVLVAIDPLGEGEADEELLDEIKGFLFRYRRIGHDVVVEQAQYVPLDIEMTVCVLPDYLRGHVKAALLELFSNRLLPDGRRGFFHPDNVTFGEGIFASKLVATARAIPGVENIIVTKLERLFEGPNQEIENGILPLSPSEIARLDNDPTFPENGRLQLNMEGGR